MSGRIRNRISLRRDNLRFESCTYAACVSTHGGMRIIVMCGIDFMPISGMGTEILQRQCGKETIYVDKKNNNSISRRGGYKRRKDSDVKIIVTPVYGTDRSMYEAIGSAVVDSYRREEEKEQITE